MPYGFEELKKYTFFYIKELKSKKGVLNYYCKEKTLRKTKKRENERLISCRIKQIMS
jgi:hypothetical protein